MTTLVFGWQTGKKSYLPHRRHSLSHWEDSSTAGPSCHSVWSWLLGDRGTSGKPSRIAPSKSYWNPAGPLSTPLPWLSTCRRRHTFNVETSSQHTATNMNKYVSSQKGPSVTELACAHRRLIVRVKASVGGNMSVFKDAFFMWKPAMGKTYFIQNTEYTNTVFKTAVADIVHHWWQDVQRSLPVDTRILLILSSNKHIDQTFS